MIIKNGPLQLRDELLISTVNEKEFEENVKKRNGVVGKKES